MRIVTFPHSLRSDWNHGNAHFLRGVSTELQERGHEVVSWEVRNGWSVRNLVQEHGRAPLARFRRAFPHLQARVYGERGPDLDEALDGADVVLVHEWNEPRLVKAIGARRAAGGDFALLFHDTHHRSVSKPKEMARYDLSGYDGVLAFGDVVRDLYLEKGWATEAWTWHEAADVNVFHPREADRRDGDLVWVGNWGDEERTRELRRFLVEPVKDLALKARIHGVRYPKAARKELRAARIQYRGWVANHDVPDVFARFGVTVHVPRRPYVKKLPGIPTIRVFEALACGIPLVSAPWDDAEGLFEPGKDFLVARDKREMKRHLRAVLEDDSLAADLRARGLEAIRRRHTCGHRADELLRVVDQVKGRRGAASRAAPGPRIAFFGSSLVSSYWNGAATYYRGILHALARRGCRVTFYEPDAHDRQKHRDIADPDWAKVVVYPNDASAARKALEDARGADVVVKASGVGVFDDLLEREALRLKAKGTLVAFWDVDAPATLDRVRGDPSDPFRKLVPEYDLVLTYGGGPPVVEAYEELGAARCVPVYNAVDPATHHPVEPEARFEADFALLANRLPDREARIEEFFLKPAAKLPDRTFLLGGSGWEGKPVPSNVRLLGHVPTRDHNALNCTPRAVLNVNRESMARFGWSPATRVFEAAGAGACLVSDAWRGIDDFLQPGKEILVAEDGDGVASILEDLAPARARAVGEAARKRVLREHTYDHRAEQVMAVLKEAGV